jgi:hypothetical protein
MDLAEIDLGKVVNNSTMAHRRAETWNLIQWFKSQNSFLA